MSSVRTDLALEAQEILNESAGSAAGIKAEEKLINGFLVNTVRVLDENGEKAIGKPVGTYITVDLATLIRREENAFDKGAELIADELKGLMGLGEKDTVLVVGLGNEAITPDAVGPMTVKNTMVTRHLVAQEPEYFGSMRPVAAVESGVLGTTGMESVELIKAVADSLAPDMVIVVDALASRRLSRVCSTVQIADTGIIPGSGVGNSRKAINRETLGVPVMALGVPTVVDAGTLAADIMEQAGVAADPEEIKNNGGMIVTPREIDSRVSDISKLLGYGINLALHDGLTPQDVTMFLS